MAVDLESLREYVALGGSALALASTGYFWVVRANRERMQLDIHPIGSLRGTVLMNEDFETFRRLSPGEGEVCVKYFADIAVVNNSSLPNALLGIQVRMRLADGQWRSMDVQPRQSDSVLVPANLDPLSTAHVPLALATSIAGTLTGGFAEREQAAGDALAATPEMEVQLTSLGGKTFIHRYRDDGRGLRRSVAQPISKAA